ncbi:MAG: HAMP domain-containing histidine kinase [Candidatus Methanofastidiosum sp.]|nr:HAMP domain-containing histidine kinase [Methanofastidiosum sp.]
MSENTINGLAFLCNLDGEVIEFIHNSVELKNEIYIGEPFYMLLDSGSWEKCHEFLKNIHYKKVALDWEMNMPSKGKVTVMYFSGFLVEDKLLIFGVNSRDETTLFIEEISKINNQQLNSLRMAMKNFDIYLKQQETKDRDLYEELGRLNNELATAQRELTKKNIQLTSLNELKNNFLGMAAHDLRNPLGLIMNYSEFLLLANPELNEKSKMFIENILSASELMRRLIDDFLDVSIIESGEFPINKQLTDLVPLLRENIERLEFKSKKKEVIIKFDYDDYIGLINIDGPKISQVFTNFLSNAIEYSVPNSKIYVMCYKDQDSIVVSVKDEGQGIPENELGNLFKFFGKASTKKTGGEKSTGLGLAIARKIIESHKGKIWVESKQGEGAKFYFSIPMLED